jgi:hypothetical protein
MAPNKTSRHPLNLDDIEVGLTGNSDVPDSETKREVVDLTREEERARIEGLWQDIDERKRYANRIFWLLVCWFVGLFLLLFMQGLLSPWKLFYLDKAVLLAAIGGTTVNVIGIFIIVTRYLFPQRSH